ncbi:MAG: MMPL family transporter [Candidatus Cloacimonadota bacterium]|nr:MMPL family transporter [Candidatus Cloacimonadota bacterium]
MTKKLERINKKFGKAAKTIVRLRWLIIVGLIFLNLIAIIGIKRIQIDVSNESWFLQDDPLMVAKHEFEDIFGNNDYVAVLVEADNVFSPKILRMMRELGQELKSKLPYTDKLMSITDLDFTRGTEQGLIVGNIVPDEIPTNPEAIAEIKKLAFSKEFLVNRLFSDDCKQAWILLRLRSYPETDATSMEEYPQLVVGRMAVEIVGQDKYKDFNLKATGMPVLNHEKRCYYNKEAGRVFGISILITIIALILLLRSFRGVSVPIITAVSSILWTFGGMGWLGIKLDNTVMIVPVLLALAVSIGYSVHIFNFFKQRFLTTGRRKEAIFYAVEHTGWPIFFTAATTIAALFSFFFVDIKTVRWMGLSAGVSVIAAYIIVMLFTPAILSFGEDKKPHPEYEKKGGGWAEHILVKFSDWVLSHPAQILTIFGIIVIALIFGLTKVEVDMRMEKMGLEVPFRAKLWYINNTKVGSMWSYDVTIAFKKNDRVKDPEVLKNLDILVNEISKFPAVKRAYSLSDIVKDLNQVMHSDNPEYHSIPNDKELVSQLLLLYEMSGGTEAENWVDYDYTTLRISAEVGDFLAKEFEKQWDYLERRVTQLFPNAKLGIVGVAVQFSTMSMYITKGQIRSLLIALIVITILMMIVFGSIKTGLIGMIPNIAPAIFAGGLMGYFGTPLDMMTMIIGPMILGLAVDDTIHFITNCKLEFWRTGSYEKAIRETFRTVGKALFMTSLILVLGFVAYVTSLDKMYFCLGGYTIVAILAALFADFFVTPVLIMLVKPFGKENNLNKEEQL